MGRHSFAGHGAYRIAFQIPHASADGSWRLRSEGFHGLAKIWLDGRRIARVDGQFLGLDVDLHEIAPGEHLLALRMENRIHRNVLPGFSAPDFLLYGGLVGRVWLERRPRDPLNTDTLSVRPALDEAGDASLIVRLGVPGSGLKVELFDGMGQCVGRDEVDAGSEASVHLERPRLWSPDEPHLYRAVITLTDDSVDRDRAELDVGFRKAEFRPGRGFFLNGQRLELHGANRHESIPGLGAALPEELQRRDAQLLKGLGCNFVRLSHYPQHPAFLDACDELGLLVYPEIATWKSVRSNRGWLKSARRQMRTLILRDRHRPSIILWGMGNESRSRKAYLQLGAIARELDPQRQTIYAENHLYRARREEIIGMPDVWGTNYELEVLKEAAASSRSGTVIVSECCNHPRSIKGDEAEELTQLNTLERDWEGMSDSPSVAGYAVWCLTDYATEHRDRFRRLPGLLDAWRRPKMAAELFRARHATEPFVALFVTGRGPQRPNSRFRSDIALDENGAHEIHVLSNCNRVELVIDGTPHRLEDAIHWVLTTGKRPGALQAEAFSHSTTVRSTWRPHGPAHRILVTPRGSPAPGQMLEIDIEVVDSDGITARDFNVHCRLTVEGAARLFAYTENDEALIARGEGRTYLRCNAVELGEARVMAAADGLESGIGLIRWG
jgi:beta-galactosidase